MGRRVFALLLLAGLLVAACGSSPSGGQGSGPKKGGTLTVAIGIDPDTLDPQAQTTTTASQIVLMMVETLVKINTQGQIVPGLATKWQAAANGLSYTFTLRQGVQFSDGESFDAQAVVTSLDRVNSATTYKAQPGVLTDISNIVAVDADHVRVDLKTPFAPILPALTQATSGILAPKSLTQDHNSLATVVDPIGTGPYMLTDRLKSDHMTLARNPHYWGPAPNYATQIYKVVPEDASRESLVKAGQAQVAALPPANDLPALRNDSSVKVIMGQSDRSIFVNIDTQDPHVPQLQNPKVRQAMNYAVNKQAIIKSVLFGAGSEATAPVSPSLFGYCQTGPYAYDPSKAKQMLQQAGAEGLTLRMGSPQGRYIEDYNAAQAVAGDLRAVGLNVQLGNPPDWPTYIATTDVPAAQEPYDISLAGWAPPYLDASEGLVPFQKANWPPVGSNGSWYTDPKTEASVLSGNAGLSTTQRKTDYCTALKQIWQDAPWIFLHYQKAPLITTTAVTGVTTLPNEQFNTVYASPA